MQKRFHKLDGDPPDVLTGGMPNPSAEGNAKGRGVLGFVREPSPALSRRPVIFQAMAWVFALQ
ncbi:hypothetical protein [Chromobacterium sp. CV08]|uniref:hypothetical protein n=1 Tax=Chromobacterium sp. CV08 TaxID=3133274 RepID=UPI003DA877AB